MIKHEFLICILNNNRYICTPKLKSISNAAVAQLVEL